ncbi:glycerophosphodiester phosphodiesterase 1-like isoform X3 [Nilaparvata lugens]|uniref:glycerophosphodiester phosphodiesterase 1-like isoform X3 n=1 Tax=Nilaparvata lugens TaxID=108931 RepID=UPI00193E61E1|nr:glycerophosphodiester phosphodiesterase 1-like isoform X3 [Nilaparvata lugens]
MKLSICLTVYGAFLLLYSIIIVAIEATSFYVGLIFTILPFLCFIILNWFAIPQPSEAVIREILGENLWIIERDRHPLSGENESAEDDTFAIKTVAHRACGLDAPENSMAAIKSCKNKGSKCIEIDLWLTADNIAVVFHDDTLERMTNGFGPIKIKTFQALQELKLAFQPEPHIKQTFVEAKIPTLDECIKFCLESDIKLILDVKDTSDEMVHTLLAMYKRNPVLYRRVIVSGFDPLFIYKIRSADPQIACSMAWRPEYFTSVSFDAVHGSKRCSQLLHRHYFSLVMDYISAWLFNHILFYLLGLSVVLLHKDVLSARTVARWQNRGIRVMAWTVNNKTEKDYFVNVLHIPYLTDTLSYTH